MYGQYDPLSNCPIDFKLRCYSMEALKSLNEAVRTAQQNGDEACLAHALAAFCALCASSAGPLAGGH